jgi:hypothetical protein
MKHLFSVAMFCIATLVHAQNCRIAGQVFFADAVDHTVSIKTDAGDLVNFSYDDTTNFLIAGSRSQHDATANRMQPENLNNGDRLCVGMSEPLVVTVTPRRKIEDQQRNEIANWQADSLYGIVSGVDQKARRIELTVSAGNKTTGYSVDVSPTADYWIIPRDSIHLSDAVAGSLDRVAAGDTLYIRGAKGDAGRAFVASLLITGGFRSYAATIESMETLNELMHVRLVLSGNHRTVHTGLGEFYAVGKVERDTAASKAHRLYRMDAADLRPGDTILILGVDQGGDSLRALALIAGFSPFGVLPPDLGQQMRWVFDNVTLGEPIGNGSSPTKGDP